MDLWIGQAWMGTLSPRSIKAVAEFMPDSTIFWIAGIGQMTKEQIFDRF